MVSPLIRLPPILLIGAALAACAQVQPEVKLPQVSAASPPARLPVRRQHWDASFQGLRRDDQRVADVAFRLATANVALCSDRAPLSGLVLQDLLAYRPALRPAAEAAFQLGDRPQVEAVAAGGPAARAGVEPGDMLMSINGAPLTPEATALGPEAPPASYAPLAAAYGRLAQALAQGPAHLGLRRGGRSLSVTLVGRPGCAYQTEVLPGPELNASADGQRVFISTAMVSFADTDARLALVLGHELAHDLLHHHQRLDHAGFARGVLGVFGSTPSSLVLTEKEADYVGLYLAARAGYDISEAPDYWRSFPASVEVTLDWTHPSITERIAALTATRDEIDHKRAAGAPLLPDFLATDQER